MSHIYCGRVFPAESGYSVADTDYGEGDFDVWISACFRFTFPFGHSRSAELSESAKLSALLNLAEQNNLQLKAAREAYRESLFQAEGGYLPDPVLKFNILLRL